MITAKRENQLKGWAGSGRYRNRAISKEGLEFIREYLESTGRQFRPQTYRKRKG